MLLELSWGRVLGGRGVWVELVVGYDGGGGVGVELG